MRGAAQGLRDETETPVALARLFPDCFPIVSRLFPRLFSDPFSFLYTVFYVIPEPSTPLPQASETTGLLE
jgi:hypothetical protein